MQDNDKLKTRILALERGLKTLHDVVEKVFRLQKDTSTDVDRKAMIRGIPNQFKIPTILATIRLSKDDHQQSNKKVSNPTENQGSCQVKEENQIKPGFEKTISRRKWVPGDYEDGFDPWYGPA
ncbi:hypothetical protein H5410_056268 [Solanum commersonii]|uniref:Uncharacterized protein n=1 Tax=Solanum commersonii TaxID=4109 RepID=A0A9J5WMM6_SOLCO|nr:hypothetical protein H5410_056268 [Solanum commersonii]